MSVPEEWFSFIHRRVTKNGIRIETMRNNQGTANGFRFHYQGTTFNVSEVVRALGYCSLFRQFG